jgi:hypothetical protein
MNKITHIALVLLYTTVLVLSGSAQVNTKPSNAQIISKVNSGLYNLSTSGLVSFKTKVRADWPVTLGNSTINPAAMKVLNGIWFSVSHSKDQTVVEHFVEVEPSAAQKDGLEQIFSGGKDALTGFFQTWDLFSMSRPVPENGGVEIMNNALGYDLKWKDGESNVDISVGPDFVITKVAVSDPAFDSVVQPRFIKTPRGLMMSGYQGTYVPKNGLGNTKLDVQIENQEASGFSLIKRIVLDTVYDGTPSKIALDFSEIEVTKKH